jgi:YD repeat-containing protein
VVEVTGDVIGRITYDQAGRLVRVAVSASGVTAVRAEF